MSRAAGRADVKGGNHSWEAAEGTGYKLKQKRTSYFLLSFPKKYPSVWMLPIRKAEEIALEFRSLGPVPLTGSFEGSVVWAFTVASFRRAFSVPEQTLLSPLHCALSW